MSTVARRRRSRHSLERRPASGRLSNEQQGVVGEGELPVGRGGVSAAIALLKGEHRGGSGDVHALAAPAVYPGAAQMG